MYPKNIGVGKSVETVKRRIKKLIMPVKFSV